MATFKKGTVGNKTIKIIHDEYPMNPREETDYLMGKMVFFGKYKGYGDKHNVEILEDYSSRYGFIEGMGRQLKKEFKAVAIIPVHVYNHSGIAFSTSMSGCFSDKWDSGTCGFVVITKEQIRECYAIKRVTKAHIDKAIGEINNEIELLNQYINGDAYGFQIEVDGEETDSCWGFFGTDWKNNGLACYVNDKELIESICN